jgi:hypothetical protein
MSKNHHGVFHLALTLNFIQMKKAYLIGIWAVVVSMTIFYSCKKEESIVKIVKETPSTTGATSGSTTSTASSTTSGSTTSTTGTTVQPIGYFTFDSDSVVLMNTVQSTYQSNAKISAYSTSVSGGAVYITLKGAAPTVDTDYVLTNNSSLNTGEANIGLYTPKHGSIYWQSQTGTLSIKIIGGKLQANFVINSITDGTNNLTMPAKGSLTIN